MSLNKNQFLKPIVFICIALFILVGLTALRFREKIDHSKNKFCIKKQIFQDINLLDGWKKVEIDSIGSYEYPESRLEIQDKNISVIVDSIRKTMQLKTAPKRFVMQQKGLNNLKNFKYVRVMIETFKGKSGDFLKGSVKIKEYSLKKQTEIKTLYKNIIINNFKNAGLQINKWYPVELMEINGSFCICLKFDRKSVIKNETDVQVRLYSFPNNNRQFDFTLACRTDDVENWKSDFNEIIQSFSISNLVKN